LTQAGPDPTETLARLDAIAAILVERAKPTTFRVTTDQVDIEIAQRLRGRATVERGWLRPDELDAGRERDGDDVRAVHVLAFRGGEAIGTCRLIYPEDARLLPMEQPPGAGRVPEVAVEVGRIVVIDHQASTQRSVMAGLIGQAWLELRAQGYQRICGVVSAPILRLFRRLGFVVRVVGPGVRTFGEDRVPILFEPEEDAAAAAADRV
jgi:N-acyl-L-homoserine lactone synthetase